MRPAPASIQSAIVRAEQGHRSALTSQALRVACKLVSIPIVARLVAPAEHGLFAMGSSAFLLLALFRDAGLGVAAIQARSLSDGQMAALFRAHLLLGALLTLATCAISGVVARFYGNIAVAPLLMTMSAAFLLIGAGGFVRSQLGRESRFVEANRVENLAVILATVAMIAAASLGAGAYTFVVFLLVSESIATALAWRALAWRPCSLPDWRGLRGLLGVGADVTVYQSVGYLLQQLDVIAVGRWFGAQAMGLYSRSALLLSLPNLHLVGPLNQVALVTLSRVRSEPIHFQSQLRITTTTIAHLVFPLFAVCIAMPADVVQLVLGAGWLDAAPLVRSLAFAGIGSTVVALGYAGAVASDRTRALAISGVLAVPCTIVAILLGRRGGVEGIAGAIASANLLLALPRLWWSLRGEPGTFAGVCRALQAPLAVNAAAIAGMLGSRLVAADFSWPARLACGAFGGAGAAVLLALLWPRVRREWRDLWNYLPYPPFRAKE